MRWTKSITIFHIQFFIVRYMLRYFSRCPKNTISLFMSTKRIYKSIVSARRGKWGMETLFSDTGPCFRYNSFAFGIVSSLRESVGEGSSFRIACQEQARSPIYFTLKSTKSAPIPTNLNCSETPMHQNTAQRLIWRIRSTMRVCSYSL